MDLQTISNITLSILSFILAVISLLGIIFTLWQNNKMLENSTRPYITIYFDYSQMGSPIGYFVIKNFGNSPAIIDALSYNQPIKELPVSLSNVPAIFDGLIGNSVAPNQKFLAPFHIHEYPRGNAVIDITYHAGKKKYSEHIEINVKSYGKLVKPRIENKEYKAISYPLQEISERLM